MRAGLGWIVVLTALTACSGKSDEEKAAQNAAAANYIPPQVTSRLDFGGIVQRHWNAMDRNGDGYVTSDELPGQNADRITALDTNRDGKVSEDEYSKGMLARFDSYDLNHDGTVTSAEYAAAHGH